VNPWQTDVISKVESILKEHSAFGTTFFEIGEHSPISGIRNGIQKYKETGCECIVAVGGGSPIDASKAILYNIQKEFGGKTPPQIAIPTTLSAAEYTVRFVWQKDHPLLICFTRLALDSPMMKGIKLPCPHRNLPLRE
jgi:alcohol dehydrogenase class IV